MPTMCEWYQMCMSVDENTNYGIVTLKYKETSANC